MSTAQTGAPVLLYDPLLISVPMPHRAEFYPYGFPVSIASNSPAVLAAAQLSWKGRQMRFDERPIEVRCLVTPSGTTRQALPPEPVVRAQNRVLVAVADAENFHCCDLENGFACAWVSERVAASADYFRYHFLEAMTYCLLDTLHLVAVHAACVSLDGQGVLLAGESGAGKSSLAYACSRRGWTYTSDDSSSLVVRGRGRTVLGNPRLFRLRDTAGKLFPEFRGVAGKRRGNGKPTIEVSTASMAGIRTAVETHVDHVVFLDRKGERPGPVELVRVPAREALADLFFSPWPPELPGRRARQATVERLLGACVYRMRYRDLDAAVDQLEQLVRGGQI
jgi:hypothetical protein